MRWFAAVGGSVRWALRPDPLGCAFTDSGESTSLIVAGVTPEGGKSVPPICASRRATRAAGELCEGRETRSLQVSERFLLPIAAGIEREKGVPATRYNLNQ